MKKITLTLLSFFLISTIFIGCQSQSKLYELPQPIKVNNAVVALEKGTFEIVPDASWFIIRVVKNDHIPVKASINVLNGSLNLNKEASFLAEATLDISSWDSSLSKRDEQIKNLLFHLDNDVYQKAFLKIQKPLKEIKTILSDKKEIKELPVQASLKVLNKDHTLETSVALKVNDKNRLVVTTPRPIKLKLEEFLTPTDIQQLKDLRKIDSFSKTFEVSAHLEFISPVAANH
jgi:hypothetical protein